MAIQSGQKLLSCWDDGSGRLVCDCTLPDGTSGRVYLSDTDLSVACNVAADICWNGAEPELTGEKECGPYPSFDYSDALACIAATQCTQTATVGGEPVSVADVTRANCAETVEGDWVCTCETETEIASFEVAPEAESLATCSDAAGKCGGTF